MQIHKIPWAPTSGRLNLLPPPFFLLFRSFFIVDRHRFASTPEYSLYRSRCERKTIFTRVAYRGFIEFFYLVISITIARSDKKPILLPVEFSIFRARLVSSSIQLSHILRFRWSARRLLRLTCTDRTRSLPSACDSRICRNSATLPYTRSSRNSSSRNGSAPVPSIPCTLDRSCNENSQT